ncbi:Archaeal/vacuolar-type H+-ATPase subunit A [Halapricum desulfuricans]|uniref:A-type ATP synthase subunit A n=1 Tax=Halapricum desulfuricans TaxID=2841257 RepID=A0A897NJ06_9EURY|nr:V-type ATP synthase subunit A [Halapricum desulfuricans]QSG10943.1 Archaeal/vacuolar-type H+-ATPase subunit A [Halapricum desulfuricans]
MSQAQESDVREDGVIESVSGPVVTADLDARMNDVVYVGHEGLMGEVIEIEGDVTTIQVYEETSGVSSGEPVETTGQPLTVDLGPGMLDSIYDGVQRPLRVLEEKMNSAFLDRGVDAPGIDMETVWEFTPEVEEGDEVEPGDIVGIVPETRTIDHKVMVPPDYEGGEVVKAKSGNFTVEEPVVELANGEEITMHQEWPVRQKRPADEKQTPTEPLVSGQRILDGLFPIAKGGTAAIPGPFGSGKCVTPETPVTLADGETLPIEELFDRLTGDVPETGEVVREADAEILTFDAQAGAIRLGEISHVYRGSTDRVVRVETASGRELEVTPAHKLFRMGAGLEIEETPAAELSVGDSLVMPRQLPIDGEEVSLDPYELLPDARAVDEHVLERFRELVEETDTPKTDLADAAGVSDDAFINYTLGRTRPTLSVIDAVCSAVGAERPTVEHVKPGSNGKPVSLPTVVDERFAELLGLVLSDGSLTEKTVRFHNSDERLRDRFAELADRLFGVDVAETVHNTVETAEVRSAVVSRLLVSLGVPETDKSITATVPDAVERGTDAIAAAFLRGYYLGDGSFSGSTMEIGTSSDSMVAGLARLLTRLGVRYRARERDRSHRIVVTGADELATFHGAIAGFEHPKIDAVGEYARTTTANTNLDTVPVDPTTMAQIAEAARYTDFAEAGVEPTNYTNLGQAPSRDAWDDIASVLADGGATLADRASSIADALDDVFFDPIVDIEVIEGEQTVYDVTVPGTQNFVGGHVPSVLHNTVTQHQLAKWADADIVVYVGCGERGNEMTEVIEDFPELEDPTTGNPLMDRTTLIANTSNMPVAARESSVYTGITIAEYFRDMGYNVALMADSTSRWAEAMREISSRLEEMPGEEGYPAYLAARLAEFYERAGYFENINGTEGSISVIGAVSPPGGDFSEPVTQNTLRIVKTFWALDADLAERRHFPAINWDESYSLYRDQLDPWFEENVESDWSEQRQWAIDTLDEESELQEIVQLVGKDALPDDQQLTLEVARYLREAWLQQNAFHDVDTYCEPEKTYRILEAIKTFNDEAFDALDAGVPVEEITDIESLPRLNRIGVQEDYNEFVDELEDDIASELREMY